MKKNKIMRAALALLVVTMLTMSIVSGTFAKYVTSGSANDAARVAKFGVVVEASGNLFDTTYVNKAGGNTPGSTNITVKSESGDVVAPGTKSSDDGLKISVKGQPEVSVNVSLNVTTANDIFLKGSDKDLPKMTTASGTDTFKNTTDYYPVKFTLANSTRKIVDGGKLADVKTELEKLSKDYDAGTNLSNLIGDLKLTWEWDFDASGAGTYDDQDTLLGDLAANTPLAPATTLTPGTNIASADYNLNAAFAITLTVTQID